MPSHYDRKSHNFWVLTENGLWTQMPKDAFATHLMTKHGLSSKPGTAICGNLDVSRVEEVINQTRQTNQIDYSCDVAGWAAGVHLMYGKRVLVQESPQFLSPAEGKWDFIEAVLRAISRVHKIQYDVIKSWWMLGLKKLYLHEYRYSQILINVGDAASGKSLIQFITTVLVGGAEADPMDWILGHTNFGKEIVENEHLCVAEPSAVTMRDQQMTWNKLKEIAVKEGRRCRGLYNEAVTVPPYQLCSMTLNPEPKNLALVPEPVPGIEDKFHACLFPSESFPLPGYPLLSMAETQKIVREQAPAFLWHLFNEYKVPKSLLKRVDGAPHDCHRFGMDPYHNPVLMTMVMERSDEVRFFSLFERIAARTCTLIFRGSVSKLSEHLQTESTDPDAKRLTQDTHKLGCLLRSLHKKFPNKVHPDESVKTKKFGTIWTILAEPNEDVSEN
jgi:hypothetical protein